MRLSKKGFAIAALLATFNGGQRFRRRQCTGYKVPDVSRR